MDLILFLFVFVLSFLAFISIVYFLARLMFPVQNNDEVRQGVASRIDLGHPRVSRKNPYSF